MDEGKMRLAAEYMLEELEASWLDVAKVPSQRGGYIRVCVSVNCEWYRRFCKAHESYRRTRYKKPRTFIKRCHTIAALKRIIAGRMDSVYAERLKPFVQEQLERSR